MRCDEIMKRGIEIVRPEDTLQHAACRMRDAKIGFLPVCDADGRIVGVITDRDITVRACAGGLRPSSTRVKRIRSRDVVTCHAEDDVSHAERLMGRHFKARLLVLDANRKLVGVLSLSDIAAHERDRPLAETVRKVVGRELHFT